MATRDYKTHHIPGHSADRMHMGVTEAAHSVELTDDAVDAVVLVVVLLSIAVVCQCRTNSAHASTRAMSAPSAASKTKSTPSRCNNEVTRWATWLCDKRLTGCVTNVQQQLNDILLQKITKIK